MRRTSQGLATGLKLTAATTALVALASGCSSADGTAPAAPLTPAPGATAPTASRTPLDVPTVTAAAGTSAKLSGGDLLTWSDWSDLGIKGLTVSFTAEPGQAALSTCEKADMRGVPGLTSLWQSTSQASGEGRVVADQQIASFDGGAPAAEAWSLLEQQNSACAHKAEAQEDLDLGSARAAAWRHDLPAGASELVLAVQLPGRISYAVIRGPLKLVKELDAEAIAARTAEQLG